MSLTKAVHARLVREGYRKSTEGNVHRVLTALLTEIRVQVNAGKTVSFPSLGRFEPGPTHHEPSLPGLAMEAPGRVEVRFIPL